MLISCAKNGQENKLFDIAQNEPVVIDTACKWVKPIFITIDEIELIENGTISAETARQILAHNETYMLLCNPDKL